MVGASATTADDDVGVTAQVASAVEAGNKRLDTAEKGLADTGERGAHVRV